MDGLFQILIVLVFVVVSILDGVSRKKRQAEQKERMEHAEAEGALEGPVPEGAAGSSSRRPASWPQGEARPQREARGGGGGAPPERQPASASGERQTTDQMVPGDLWAILTGQAPLPTEVPRTPQGSAPQERTPQDMGPQQRGPQQRAPQQAAPPRGMEPARARVPENPSPGPVLSPMPGPMAPVPSPVPATMGAPRLEPVPVVASGSAPPTRRSARWMEGLDREPSEVRTGRRVADGLDEQSVWGAYQDISLGEIGSAEEDGLRYEDPVPGAAAAASGSPGRSGRATHASSYVSLLTSGREEDLRSAIVLREVLGPPMGAQDGRWD